MAKKIFIWADSACNGENVEWVELTREEYLVFKKNPANKKRKFIRLTDHYSYESDVLYFEATQEAYREWVAEYQHSLYLKRLERKYSTFSLDETEGLDFVSDEHEWDDYKVQTFATQNLYRETLESIIPLLSDSELVALEILEKKIYSNIKIETSLIEYGIRKSFADWFAEKMLFPLGCVIFAVAVFAILIHFDLIWYM